MKWVQIKSWHAVKFYSRGNQPRTYCGRWTFSDAEVVEDLPAGRSCETCLRLIAREADA